MAILKDILGTSAETILDNLSDLGDKYINLEKIIPAVNNMLTDQAKEMRQLNKELGTGSRTSAELRQSFAKLSKEIGVATSEIYELVSQTKEYHQGITESTSSTIKFMKASGASSDIVGKFSAKLNILGKSSKESMTGMYEGILSVRDAYGLTDSQIDNIISSLEKYAVITGASTEKMKEASVTLAKFTSQLTSAGMAADEVSDIINGMLDPDRMTNNLALMSKLGISISDMVSGDPITALDGAAERIKTLSQEIVNISKTNRIQANEVAKVYGLTLEQAATLANLDTSTNALNTQKKLEQYRQEMTTFTESISNVVNVLSGVISGPLLAISKVFEAFGNTLGMLPRGISALLVAVTGKKILNAISEKLGEAAKRFGKNVGESLNSYLDQVDKRYGTKQKDKTDLTPKNGEVSGFNYGFGLNYQIKAEAKKQRLNDSLNIKNPNKELTAGETLEYFQNIQDSFSSLEKQYVFMSEAEKAIFDRTYGSKIRTFKGEENDVNSFSGIVGNMLSKFNSGWENSIIKSNIEQTDESGMLRKYLAIEEEFSKLGVTNLGDSLRDKDVLSLANISSGPKEFLEKMIEFYKLSDKADSAKNLESAVVALEDFQKQTVQTAASSKRLRELMIESNEILSNPTKGEGKNRISALFSGITTNIGTFFKSFNPLKLLKGGAVGLLGGVGVKLLSSLSKNEKFQESMSKITESFSGLFSGLVEKMEPIFEPLTNLITSIVNFIAPFIEKIAGGIGLAVSWVSGKLNKVVTNISDSVSTIEDSYKQADLRTMVAATGSYDSAEDKLNIIMNGISYKIDKVLQNQNTTADTLLTVSTSK